MINSDTIKRRIVREIIFPNTIWCDWCHLNLTRWLVGELSWLQYYLRDQGRLGTFKFPFSMPSLLKRMIWTCFQRFFNAHFSKKQGKFAFRAYFQEFPFVFKEKSEPKSQKIVILPSKRKEKFFPKRERRKKRFHSSCKRQNWLTWATDILI